MRRFIFTTAFAALIAVPGAASAQSGWSQFDRHAVAQELRDRASGEIEQFYAARSYQPVWIVGGRLSPAGAHFLDLVAQARLDGLNPRSYDPDDLAGLALEARSGDGDRIARAELKFMREFLRYVGDLRQPSREMHYSDSRLREVPSGQDILRQAEKAGSFDNYVRTMGWMSPYYVQLRQALLQIEARAVDPAPVLVPAGRVLREGDRGPEVSLLRRRLGVAAGDVFDADLAHALRTFQEQSGLTADAVAGPRTIAALNGPPAETAPLLRVNLERARALPSPWTRHIIVNSAEARLSYFGDGAEQGSMKVVVGTAETPTPVMAGMIYFATLNPYWNVPVSLAQRNIAPAVLNGASLGEMRYEALSDWTEEAVVIDQNSVDWRAVVAGREQVRLRKLPGPGNAMGGVKYIFPNDLGIYLHDTPDRHLFHSDARQFSNGCVRLEDAGRLGEWFFGSPLQTSSGAPEEHILLPEPVPVYLTYLTAIPQSGTIAFTADVYDLDGGASGSKFLASR